MSEERVDEGAIAPWQQTTAACGGGDHVTQAKRGTRRALSLEGAESSSLDREDPPPPPIRPARARLPRRDATMNDNDSDKVVRLGDALVLCNERWLAIVLNPSRRETKHVPRLVVLDFFATFLATRSLTDVAVE